MKLNRNTSSSLLKLISLVYREHRDKFGGQQYQPKKKPYMRYREIEVVEEILYNLQPTSCLEWGAGSSTLFFPPKLHRKLDGFRSSINSHGWKGFKTFNQVLLSAFITYRRINCPGPMKCKMGLMPILLTTLNTPSNLLPMILSWLMVVRATTASKKRLVLSNQKGWLCCMMPTGKAITRPLSAILIRFCSVDTVHMQVGYGLEAEESLFQKS